MPKRQRTTAEQRRDEYDGMIRRSLSLIALYQEMAESHLASEAFDAELVKRMLATRVRAAADRGRDALAALRRRAGRCADREPGHSLMRETLAPPRVQLKKRRMRCSTLLAGNTVGGLLFTAQPSCE
jgi:hypothetical protein